MRNASEIEVQEASAQIPQHFIFEHPTLYELAEAISELAGGATNDQDRVSTVDAINAMLDKYSAGLPAVALKAKTTRSENDKIVVLLTGSTGNVGSHLLAALLAEPRVSKVYTLNRLLSGSVNATVDRQRASFEVLNLPVALLSHEKYVPLLGNLNTDAFGLEQTVYEQVIFIIQYAPLPRGSNANLRCALIGCSNDNACYTQCLEGRL